MNQGVINYIMLISKTRRIMDNKTKYKEKNEWTVYNALAVKKYWEIIERFA